MDDGDVVVVDIVIVDVVVVLKLKKLMRGSWKELEGLKEQTAVVAVDDDDDADDVVVVVL